MQLNTSLTVKYKGTVVSDFTETLAAYGDRKERQIRSIGIVNGGHPITVGVALDAKFKIGQEVELPLNIVAGRTKDGMPYLQLYHDKGR